MPGIKKVCRVNCLPTAAYGDSLDWKNLSATEIAGRVTSKVKPGSIVLFHNAALHTPEALPIIIETLQQDGYKIVPISELILTEDYTIDHSGMQIPNKQKNAKVNKTQNADTKKTEEKSQPASAPTDIIAITKPLSENRKGVK